MRFILLLLLALTLTMIWQSNLVADVAQDVDPKCFSGALCM